MLAPCLGWVKCRCNRTTTLQWGERVQLTANWLLTLEELNAGVADSAAWPLTDTTAGGLKCWLKATLTPCPPLWALQATVLQKSWLVTSWDWFCGRPAGGLRAAPTQPSCWKSSPQTWSLKPS